MSASEKSAKRKAALAQKRDLEKKASEAMGKEVKILIKKHIAKPKAKAKNGQANSKKYILHYSIKVNKKTGEIVAVQKAKKDKKKQEGATAGVSNA